MFFFVRTLSTLFIALCSFASLQAQIVVNSLDDDGGPGDCELREAITNANNDDQSGSTDCATGVGDDTIDLTGLGGTIILTSQLPVLNDSLTIQGPGADALTIDADRVGRVFYIGIAVVVTIDGVTITGGQSTSGAGIRNEGQLTVSNSIITDNIANSGAGIYNQADEDPDSLNGWVYVVDSEISNNNSAAYDQGNGGGINNNRGTMIIEGSTISGNHSRVGGGIYNFYTMNITNSTVSGNSASNGGGAVNVAIPGDDVESLTMEHTTVADNYSDVGAGGLRIGTNDGVDTAHVSLYSSVIAGNGLDVTGHVTETLGYNIVGNDALSTGLVHGVNNDQVGTSGSPIDPRLYPLADNGGPTFTHLPKPDSPAIDNGSCALTSLTIDQRGTARAQDLDNGAYPNSDDGCDVGAVEVAEGELQSGIEFVGTVLLEGAYDGAGGMNSALNGLLPLSQPYSDAMFDGTPLDYDGSESVVSIPADVVDWVLVSLRGEPASGVDVVGSTEPAFVTEKGTIVGLDGDTLRFDDVPPGSYHVIVRHRNHLSVISSDPVPGFTDGFGEWDFTSGIGQAYSNGGDPMKIVEAVGVYAMFAADGDADGLVTAPDFNIWNAATSAGLTGYEPADFDLDSNVTAPDFNLWNANTSAGAASQVPE